MQRPILLYCRDRVVVIIVPSEHRTQVCRVMEIPEGIISDGFVRDPARLCEVLESLLSGERRAARARKNTPVHLVAPEALVFTHVLTFSGKPSKKDLLEGIKRGVAAIIPFPYDALTGDHRILSSKDSTETKVLFRALSSEYVQGYVDALLGISLELTVIEGEMTALARALMPDSVTVTAILDIGRTTTNLSIFDDASTLPKLSLMIPVAGNAFTDVLVSHMNIEREEAERLKRSEGFDMHAGDGRTLVILQERAQAILAEVFRAFSSYERTSGKRVERIILAGGSSVMPSLDKYFSMNLNREVIIGDPLPRLKHAIVLPKDHTPLEVAPILGLSMRLSTLRDGSEGMNLMSSRGSDHSELHYIRSGKKRHMFGILVFIISIFCSLFLLYRMIYLPFAAYKAEALGRIPPTVPFTLPPVEHLVVVPTEGEVITPSAQGEMSAVDQEAVSVTILQTPTGWLNARSGPGTTFSIVERVYPTNVFPLLQREGDWLELALPEGRIGWVHNGYATTSGE